MIDQLRQQLDELGENYVEKNAAFKIKVIPFFCAIRIKKDHKSEGRLSFYSSQLLEIFLVVLFFLEFSSQPVCCVNLTQTTETYYLVFSTIFL